MGTAPAISIAPRRVGPELRGGARFRHGLRRGLAAEGANWRSIARALTGRPRVPRGASGFSHDKPVRTVLVVFLVLSAVEIPVVDLLVHPWPAVRIPLLVIGFWGVLTMLGMLLGGVTRPHAVGPEGIRVRRGGEIDIDLPWDVVASVERRRRALAASPSPSLTGPEDAAALSLVVQDGTDIDIALERPTALRLPQGEVTVVEVRLAVDDPKGFLDAVRAHIP